MHQNKGKTIFQCLSDRTDYAKNPEKTRDGELVSSYACDPDFVASEFTLTKKEYCEITGRYQENDVIAYQIRQSCKPGEVTPEEANKIGYEFARRFTKGDFAFIVCTHTDKAHIHNHIIWNSTALDCTRKFKNFWRSTEAVRKLSDQICMEHRLSVIENPQKHGTSYNKWLGVEYKLSNRDLLRMAIDQALQKRPKNVDELIHLLEKDGYKVKRGKYLSFRAKGQKQYMRLRSLGDDYSEESLLAVMKGGKHHKPFVKKRYPKKEQRTTLVSQLEAKLHSGKGYWYDQSLKVERLKQMAKTMLFLEEQGYPDAAEFSKAVAEEQARFQELKTELKAIEGRLEEIEILKTHILNYIKTNEVWKGYLMSRRSKTYRSKHEGEIILHEASKKAFDELGLKKLPTIKSLNEEYSKLLSKKKVVKPEYQKAREKAMELMTYKANVDYILGHDEPNDQRREYQYE